jgi:hypothetical protein
MCHVDPPPGFYGYVVSFPSQNLAILWFALLGPFALLLWWEIVRFIWPMQPMWTLPCMRMPDSSYEIQSGRWYLIQLVLSFITCGVIAFVEIPTDLSWAMWRASARATTHPGCLASFDSIVSVHNWINVAVVSLGIFAPFLIALIRALRSMYPPAR